MTAQSIPALARRGLTLGEIAQLTGRSYDAVRMVCGRRGIEVASTHSLTLVDRVRCMHPEAARDFLLDVIEQLAPELSAVSQEALDLKLTPMQARMFDALRRRLGQVLERAVLMDHCYADRSVDEIPEIKIIDVQACKMRGKLEGSPFELETVWGRGYRLMERRALISGKEGVV